MTKLVFAVVIALSLAPAAAAQQSAPRFEDYPVREVYTGPVHAPVLATREQRQFRTRLRDTASGKPNFAGHYILGLWGCGSGCVMGGVVDAKTGQVTMLPFTVCCWRDDIPDDFQPIDVRVDSNLVIVEGAIDENYSDNGKRYFTFQNGRFTKIEP